MLGSVDEVSAAVTGELVSALVAMVAASEEEEVFSEAFSEVSSVLLITFDVSSEFCVGLSFA